MALRLSSLRAARRLRSLHFVPGGSQKFLDKALASRADALIIDLEDSVLPAEKPAARVEVGKWMTSTQWGDKTVCVRINPLDTNLWEDDVEATLKADKPDARPADSFDRTCLTRFPFLPSLPESFNFDAQKADRFSRITRPSRHLRASLSIPPKHSASRGSVPFGACPFQSFLVP